MYDTMVIITANVLQDDSQFVLVVFPEISSDYGHPCWYIYACFTKLFMSKCIVCHIESLNLLLLSVTL